MILLLANPSNKQKALHLIHLPQQLPHRVIKRSPEVLDYRPEVLLLQGLLDVVSHLLEVHLALGYDRTGLRVGGGL